MLNNQYPIVLILHNDLRWFILLSGSLLILVCLLGKLKQFPFKKAVRIPALIYVSLMDTQFLFGLILSFTSPLVKSFWNNPSAGMKSHDLRFFAIEHTTFMIVALALAHIGSVRSRRIPSEGEAYSTALKWYGASFVLILAGTPWWRLS